MSAEAQMTLAYCGVFTALTLIGVVLGAVERRQRRAKTSTRLTGCAHEPSHPILLNLPILTIAWSENGEPVNRRIEICKYCSALFAVPM